MRKSLLLISLVLCWCFSVKAQNLSVQGILRDQETRTPVSGATVQLQSRHDATVSFTTYSDTLGHFLFNNIRSDTFNLIVSSIGYETLSRTVRVDSATVNIGVVTLPKTSKQLAGVTVTVKEPPAIQKGDTVQFNANQFKVNPDATVEDLAKKMPGIIIQNGQVTANGETVQKVTIDGRDLFGDDATAALRNLPAEIVDKIQVFDRLSDQAQFTGFDDGNTTKSLNIITKANMRNGQYGRVYAGYGTDNRYQGGGNATFLHGTQKISVVGLVNNVNQQNFSTEDLLGVTSSGGQRGGRGGQRGGGGQRGNGGGNYGGGFGNNSNFLVGQQSGINKTNSFGINYADDWGKKIQISGSYFFNNTNNTTNQISNTQYFLKSIPSNTEISDQNSTNNNHRFNMRFDYKIDSANELLIIPSLSFQSNKATLMDSIASYYNPSELVSSSNNATNSIRSGNNLNNTILFRHAFAKRGRTISINLNTSYNLKDGDIYLNGANHSYQNTGVKDSITQQLTDQHNSGYQIATNIAYTEPVGKKGQLQLNYNPSYSNSNADQESYRFNPNDSKYSLRNDSLSNTFSSTYKTQNGGISFRRGDRNNMFSVGVSYQYSTLASDRIFPYPAAVNKSFNNILPNAMLRMKFSAKSSLRVFYRASVNQPSVTQLQDVYDAVTNPPNVIAGNPNLKQQYNQLLSTRYTYTNAAKGTLFVANIFLQGANDYIANATYTPVNKDSTIGQGITLPRGYQLTKPVNVDGYLSFRSFLTFAVPVKFIKSNVNMNGGVIYTKLPGILNNLNSMSKTLTYNVGAVIGSNISQYVDFTVSYSANFNRVKNNIQTNQNANYFSQLAGAQLMLLSKNGWFFQNDLSNQLYSGLTAGYNQNYWLWNISGGKKLLKNQKGELKLTVFDLLKQNQSIVRTVTESYTQDVQSQVLRQYFMLTFTYNLRNFGKGLPSRNSGPRNWNGGGMRPPGGF